MHFKVKHLQMPFANDFPQFREWTVALCSGNEERLMREVLLIISKNRQAGRVIPSRPRFLELDSKNLLHQKANILKQNDKHCSLGAC